MTGGPTEERRKAHLESGSASGSGVRRPQAVRWTVLKPTKATSNLPRLSVQDDASVFASGDQSKRDLYTLRFSTEPEADHRDPARGPPRRSAAAWRAGPSLLRGAVRRLLPERVECRRRAARRYRSSRRPPAARTQRTAAAAIDGDPQTGWSSSGGQGQAHSAVFQLAAPLGRCR